MAFYEKWKKWFKSFSSKKTIKSLSRELVQLSESKELTEVDPITGIEIAIKPPVRPARFFGVLIVLIFFGGFGLWAFLAPIESAAVAPGKIVVAGNRRVIQHLEGGIVKAIFVKDGSKVKKGQVLLRLDDKRSSSSYTVSRGEVNQLLAIEARLLAERDNAKKIVFPARLLDQKNNSKVAKILKTQLSLFQANRTSLEGNLDILRQRIEQLNEQMKGINAQLISSVKQIKLLREELKAVIYLEKRKLIDRPRMLRLQRDEAKLIGNYGENLSKRATLKQKIGETQLQIDTILSEKRKEIETELRKVEQQLAIELEKEKAAEDVYQRTAIRSPQDGTVVNLEVNTVGGVIKPGQNILEVVPSKESLVVEARVSPLDIDVVHQGLVAKVQITALKQRTTPSLLGKVTSVSADALTDEKSGESFYEARIDINPDQLKKLRGQVLYPGMPVQVMIITAKLTPWQYFVSPITSSFQRAFKEQ